MLFMALYDKKLIAMRTSSIERRLGETRVCYLCIVYKKKTKQYAKTQSANTSS